jgi:hypothetical protein
VSRPAVYGTPGHFAMLLGSIAALVEREPDETFADVGVRRAAKELRGVLGDRLGVPDMANRSEVS